MTGRIHTGEILEVLKEEGVKKAVEDSMKIFEAELVNYTPLMPGDFDTKTFHCEDPNDEKTCRPAGIPLAQQLRGRMRWLARLVIASLEDCDKNTYNNIESECGVLELSDETKMKMGLIEFMFGTLNARDLLHKKRRTSFASPFIIQIKPTKFDCDSSCIKSIWLPSPETSLSPQVKDFLESLKSSSQIFQDRYHTLLTLNKTDIEKLEVAPIKPGAMEIKVEIRVSPAILSYLNKLKEKPTSKRVSLIEKFPQIATFYSALAVITLTIFGIGKAVNRGFGRFKLKNESSYVCNGNLIECEELEDILKNLYDLQENVENSLNAREKLAYILYKLIDTAGKILNSKASKNARARQVPSLIIAINGLESLDGFKVIEANHITTIDDAIEVIAASTLKRAWRNICGFKEKTEHVMRFLGLPRGRKLKGRRQSFFVLFPLPNPKFIVIMPFYALDLLSPRNKMYYFENFKKAYNQLEKCINKV